MDTAGGNLAGVWTWDDCQDVFRPAALSFEQWPGRPPGAIFCPVWIVPAAFWQMAAHLLVDATQEHAGWFVGRVFEDPRQGCFTLVEEAHASRLAERTPTWVRFRMDGHPAEDGRTVVGWYHSHPGLEITLSDTDRRTHRQHFPHAWSMAIVMDPQSGTWGTYYGQHARPIEPDWSVGT